MNNVNDILKIGTRGSALALWQAEKVKSCLLAAWPHLDIHIIPIQTSGDQILDRSLADIGGKGLFVKEIEEALLTGTIDIAVHSVKDMPAELPTGLHLAAVLRREEYRDALVSKGRLMDLPKAAVVGTSSLRRRVLLAQVRPDLVVKDCRGNVDTRLRKLDAGEYDAILLSAAGLIRLGLSGRISETLDWIPAIGQGVIGIECRVEDADVHRLLAPLNDSETAEAIAAERAFMRELEGSCRVALGCFAVLESDQMMYLKGFWVNPKNSVYWQGEVSGNPQEAVYLGQTLALRAKQK